MQRKRPVINHSDIELGMPPQQGAAKQCGSEYAPVLESYDQSSTLSPFVTPSVKSQRMALGSPCLESIELDQIQKEQQRQSQEQAANWFNSLHNNLVEVIQFINEQELQAATTGSNIDKIWPISRYYQPPAQQSSVKSSMSKKSSRPSKELEPKSTVQTYRIKVQRLTFELQEWKSIYVRQKNQIEQLKQDKLFLEARVSHLEYQAENNHNQKIALTIQLGQKRAKVSMLQSEIKLMRSQNSVLKKQGQKNHQLEKTINRLKNQQVLLQRQLQCLRVKNDERISQPAKRSQEMLEFRCKSIEKQRRMTPIKQGGIILEGDEFQLDQFEKLNTPEGNKITPNPQERQKSIILGPEEEFGSQLG